MKQLQAEKAFECVQENSDKLYFDRIYIHVVISPQTWSKMVQKHVKIEDGTKKKIR
jgi:hypothetical protein